MEDLVLLIEKFPSRLKNLNDGKGIPISVRFSPENLHNTHNEMRCFPHFSPVYLFFLVNNIKVSGQKNYFSYYYIVEILFSQNLDDMLSIM